MECVQKNYHEPTEVLRKGSTADSADFPSPEAYDENDAEMIDIMDVWKANYATIRDVHHEHHTFQLEYPTSASSDAYYADDNCNTVVEYDGDQDHQSQDHHSEVTEVIRSAVEKAGVKLQDDKRRVSRQFLTNLNIAQLQVIVNDLQRYIELLNDELVQLLMERDELQMSQDATLIDIEDLSLYF